MTLWTPSPTQYADPASVKLPAWVKVTDPSRDTLFTQFIMDATRWVKSTTGRAWVVPAAATDLTYDSSLSARLYTADFVDVASVVVRVGGTALTVNVDYRWLWRTLDGDYRHAYGLRLLSGWWADSANAAGRPVEGDVVLTGGKPSTTLLPPGPVVQATQRKTLEYYLEWRASFQRLGTSGEDTGEQPAATIDAESVLGPFLHPRRKFGRP